MSPNILLVDNSKEGTNFGLVPLNALDLIVLYPLIYQYLV